MAYHVRFSPSEAFAAVELAAVVRWDDVASALCALLGHPAWRPSLPVLWDALSVTALDASPRDLPGARGLMEGLASQRSGGRTALVVTREVEERLCIGPLVATLAGLGVPTSREVQTFGSREEALRFLGRHAMPEGLTLIASS